MEKGEIPIMDKKVWIPHYLREYIKPLRQGYPQKVKLLVFDTETLSATSGYPYLLIFYNGKKVSTFHVDKNTILEGFFNYLLENCTSRKHSYIMFAHNLPFDLTAVFDRYREKIFPYRSMTYYHVQEKTEKVLAEVRFFTHKIWFAQIKLCNGVNIKVVDSFAFIQGSLYNLSRILGFQYKKLKRPIFVTQGKKPKNRKEWKQLYKYCHAEIKAQYELAQWILTMHKKYDSTFTVSIAQLSSKIFRKHFLKTSIPQIPEHIRKLAEYTIHGGRASTFVETPCLIFNVKMYDYNSFYSFSMANLPPMTRGEWVKTDSFIDEHEGFYWIWGYVKPCKYPLIIKNIASMKFANNEYLSEIPIASYELREALRNHELDLKKIHGYIWIPHEKAVNPFKDYVEHFFQLKAQYEKTNPLYIQAKLLLNSLYGKCYQTLIDEDSEHQADYYINFKRNCLVKIEKTWKAGGLYLPHVGSWITSQCRAILHKALHDYEAIDCSTDSFKTNMNVSTSHELGGFKLESEGMLLLLRPKLYVMFSLEKQREFIDSTLPFTVWLKENLSSLKIGKDKDIIKFATHGFWGKPSRLLEMVANGNYVYEVKRMRKIREALRQHKNPRVMFTQKRALNMDWHLIDSSFDISKEWGKLK